MLYLSNTTEAQAVYVPINGDVPSGELLFKGKSTIDLDTEIDLQVVDLQVSALYMYLSVILPEGVTPGEYEYTVSSQDNETLSTGLLVVGENSAPTQYEKSITYEQYQSE